MKGTAGAILLNEYMPPDIKFDLKTTIDSGVFKSKMTAFAKKYPDMYAKKISKIAHLGEKMAFYLGSNIGPDDLVIGEKERKAVIHKIESKMNKAKTVDEKRNILLGGLESAIEATSKIDIDKNEIAQQVKSGSRGKPAQFARMTVGPIYAVDMSQLPKPTLIKNNFTRGLGSHEYFNVASQGRFSSVQAANATSEPGELGKILVANGEDMMVTMSDCGTKNGALEKSSDHHIMGRYLAGTNTVIDKKLFLQLKRKGGMVMVRSPLTCKAPKGVCAKCYGLKPDGRLPSNGDNIGIKASQTIGEVMTQMTLSTKHSTMGKSNDDSLVGVSGFKAIANSPASFTGAAVVAKEAGSVVSIESAPQGGKFIYIGKTKYHIPSNKTVKVKIGVHVNRGQPMSSGVITPKQVMENRSIGEAMRHESNLLHGLFLKSTGKDLQKKHFEVLARSHLSLGVNKIGKVGGFNDMMSSYPRISKPAMVDKSIINMYFADDLGSYKKGTHIDAHIIKKLKEWSIPRVLVTTEKPPVKPLFKSLEQRPSFSDSMFKKMNYRHLGKAVTNAIYTDKADSLGAGSSDRAKYVAGVL